MLIKTIRMETEDGTAFSKDAPLLAAASELAFHTINCSALNAEELRREDGIEVLRRYRPASKFVGIFCHSLLFLLTATCFFVPIAATLKD